MITLPVASRAESAAASAGASTAAAAQRAGQPAESDKGSDLHELSGHHGLSAGQHEEDHAEVERFFSSEPPAIDHHDAFHDLAGITGEHDPVHHHHHRRGLWLTVVFGCIGILIIGGILLYNRVLMPTPEELGVGTVALPTPAMLTGAAAVGDQEQVPVAEEVVTQGAEVPADELAAPANAAQQAAATAVQPAPTPQVAAPTGTDLASYQTLLEQARKQGFKQNAEATYLQAITIHSQGSEALSGLAMLYLNRGKNKDARDRAEQAVSADKTNSEGWIVLGAALGALGDAAAAREAYATCAALSEGKYVGECKRMLR